MRGRFPWFGALTGVLQREVTAETTRGSHPTGDELRKDLHILGLI
jgi:hypothetical protein